MAGKKKKAKGGGGTVKGPVGRQFTKKLTRGPNAGDTVRFRVAPSGKPYPVRVIKDRGKRSTLRNNSGVKFGKGK